MVQIVTEKLDPNPHAAQRGSATSRVRVQFTECMELENCETLAGIVLVCSVIIIVSLQSFGTSARGCNCDM